jgi:excisionase family DNA binding protein
MPKAVVDLDDFYTVDEAANLLGKGVATLWRWIRDKKIIMVRISGRTLVPKSEIERLSVEVTT